jgi:hypothetical protein
MRFHFGRWAVPADVDRQQRLHFFCRTHGAVIHPGHHDALTRNDFTIFAGYHMHFFLLPNFKAEAASDSRIHPNNWRQPTFEKGRIDPGLENTVWRRIKTAGYVDRLNFREGMSVLHSF